MSQNCARCTKIVYPVDKLSCLDKVCRPSQVSPRSTHAVPMQTWHNGCFNCEVCGLKLTMKTYKGYQKKPYCNTYG